MPEATKVLYDVSQAIRELNKLNDKVEEAGETASKSFEKGGKSAIDFDKAIKELPDGLRDVLTESRTFFGLWGSSGLVLGAAAGAVASVVANLLDLKTVLRDTSSNYEGFVAAIDKVREARESLSTFQDVAAQRDLEGAKRAVKLDQADLKERQNLLEVERTAAQQRLAIIKDEVKKREAIVKDGLKKEQSLRDKLAERTATNAADNFGGPGGKRTLDLGAAARSAAFDGNIKLAEELEAAAKKAAEEEGNHTLFLRDQAATRDVINRELERQIASQKVANNGAKSDLDRFKQLEAAAQADVNSQNERLRIIQRQNRELSRQVGLIRDATLEQRNVEQADAAARGIQTRAKGVNEFTRGGLESGFESFNRAVEDFKQSVTGGASDQRAVDTFSAEFIRSLQPILELTTRIQRGESVTARDINAVQGDILTATKFEAVISKALQEGRVNENRVGQVEQFQQVIQQILDLNKEASSFRRVRGDDTAIREGSTGPTRDDFRSMRDAVLGLTRKLEEIPAAQSQAAAAASQVNSQGIPQTVGARTTSSNVTVNANVKGGIIDQDVVQKITDIIRREIRKQTSQGAS